MVTIIEIYSVKPDLADPGLRLVERGPRLQRVLGRGRGRERGAREDDCPGRKPAFLCVKRPARPYKSPIQNVFS